MAPSERVTRAPDSTPELRTERLVLTPLHIADAVEMAPVLAHAELYAFTGGDPPSLDELERRYRAQVGGSSTDDEVWHNWIIRLHEHRTAIGFVQATVTPDGADLAWVVGTEWQKKGFATEAAAAICAWLDTRGVEHFSAHIHPTHEASAGVAIKIGLRPTHRFDDEGEVVWSAPEARRAD